MRTRLAIGLIVFLAAGCSEFGVRGSEFGVRDLRSGIQDPRSEIRDPRSTPNPEQQNAGLLVSTDWLQAHLRDRGLVIVEVGDRANYEKQHIPGARFLALSDIAVTRNEIANELPDITQLEATMRAAGIPDRGRIVIYSREILAATRAFFTFDYLGCETNVLDGGLTKWTAEGRTLASGPPVAQSSAFTARPHPEKVVRLAAMRKLVDAVRSGNASLAIIDTRPTGAYLGTETGHGIERTGHIPGAVSIPWSDNLTTATTPVFRTPDELKALYDDLGARDEPAVVYCRTGMQASLAYFALRHLGREVYLYDGSFMEWNCAPDTIVERAPSR